MNSKSSESNPADLLLQWLSAKGKASRPTIMKATVAIDARFHPGGKPSSFHHHLNPLRRIGHIEEIWGGYATVQSTLCWTNQPNKGLFLGARDGPLMEDLTKILGTRYEPKIHHEPWPTTWSANGDRVEISAALAGRGLIEVDEPGIRLLSSLPTLEEALSAWHDCGTTVNDSWEVAVDLKRGRWSRLRGVWTEDGIVRSPKLPRRVWMIARRGTIRPLDTTEKRAVAWWAEHARLGRPRLVYHRATRRLRLPESFLPPPLMIERPLIWASGEAPVRSAANELVYESIEPERVAQVSRILGIQQEDVS